VSAPKGNSGDRREFIANGVRGLCLLSLGGVGGLLLDRAQADDAVWQIDPYKCISCDRCATSCVLDESAVKCCHNFSMCGYCDLCTGYFEPEPNALNTGAENQLCPTGAIQRKFVEDPFFQYTIDEKLCIGCAKCVKGCNMFGNGSLHLQIQRDRCVDCNECSIGARVSSNAIQRIPLARSYLPKGREEKSS